MPLNNQDLMIELKNDSIQPWWSKGVELFAVLRDNYFLALRLTGALRTAFFLGGAGF